MTPENPDHYKYMPRRPGEEPEGELQTPSVPITEDVEVIEEILVEEAEVQENQVNPVSPDGSHGSENAERILTGALSPFYWIFNPFMAATYASLLIFLLSILAITAPGAATVYTLTVFGATCLFPIIAIFVLKAAGAISYVTLRTRRDRVFPYVLEIVGMGAMTLFFAYKGAPQWLTDVFIGATATVAVNFAINFFWRISNHCSAIAALMGVFFAINRDGLPHEGLGWWMIGVAIAIGIVGTASILIGRHRLKDVFLGYATGFLPVILFSLIR